MNYNYVLNTGYDSISQSRTNFYDSNNEAAYTQNGFSFDTLVVTGSHTSLVSLNSQTLLEESVITTQGINKKYHHINSGDYYVLTGTDDVTNIFYIDSIEAESQDLILYDRKSQLAPVIVDKTSSSLGSWNSALADLITAVDAITPISDSADLEDKFMIFFNGQKVIDLEGSSVINNLDEDITGRLSAIQKSAGLVEYSSGEPDVYGTGFVSSQVNYYLNGMEINPSEFLETHTGVASIETGVSCVVSLTGTETKNYTL